MSEAIELRKLAKQLQSASSPEVRSQNSFHFPYMIPFSLISEVLEPCLTFVLMSCCLFCIGNGRHSPGVEEGCGGD